LDCARIVWFHHVLECMDSTSFELLWWMVIFTSGIQRSSIYDRPIRHLMAMVLFSLCITDVLRYAFTRLDIFWGYHQCIIFARQFGTLALLEQPILFKLFGTLALLEQPILFKLFCSSVVRRPSLSYSNIEGC
jgi:hypothetical protein